MRSSRIETRHIASFYILLPVLNEDYRLRGFVSYYLKELLSSYNNIHLVIITTEKEKVLYPRSKTLNVAKTLAKKYESITHIHAPHRKGVMAHQLNYAIKRLPDDSICAVYNADSRPEPQTFSWISSRVAIGKDQVFQQYGLYLKNTSFLLGCKAKSVLLANAYWQCRWSLGFEFYRAYITQTRRKYLGVLRPFNYCIGHGIFITTKLIKSIKFSEKTTNEDAILGLELAKCNIPVCPVPFFDIADSPDSIKSIYIQKSVWFQGPYQAMLYYKLLNKSAKFNLILFISSAKLFTHSIYWTLGPLSMIASIALAISGYTIYLEKIFLLGMPFLFLAVPTIVAKIIFEYTVFPSRKYSKSINHLDLILGVLPAYVIHGAAAVRGIILSKSMSKGSKPKTAMMQNGEV